MHLGWESSRYEDASVESDLAWNSTVLGMSMRQIRQKDLKDVDGPN